MLVYTSNKTVCLPISYLSQTYLILQKMQHASKLWKVFNYGLKNPVIKTIFNTRNFQRIF